MLKPIAIAAVAAMTLAGCAQKPEAIKASYVSPTTYSGWNCTQLAQEAARVDNALVRASAQQNRARSNDTMGVILLLVLRFSPRGLVPER